MNEEFNPQDYTINPDDYNSFVKRLKEKDKSELDIIITRYISYKPEMVEAALYVAVDKGVMTYDAKELISGQIRTNFSNKVKIAKQSAWEKNNAFVSYVSGYDDDKIYEIIDNPADIVIDVYHAVLITALKRELISKDDFARSYNGGIKAIELENETLVDKWINSYKVTDEEPVTEEEIEIGKESYWKCPDCSELVNMDLAICWKCGAPIPEKIEHPGTDEIIREIRSVKSFNPQNTGLTLIGGGILIVALSIVRGHPWAQVSHVRWYNVVIGILAFLAGVVIVIYKMFERKREE